MHINFSSLMEVRDFSLFLSSAMKSDELFLYILSFFFTGHQIKSALSPNETITPAAKSILSLLHLPKILKKILAFFTRQTGGDPMASQLYDIMHTKSVVQDRKSIVARDVYRARWHEKWIEEGLDFVLTVPHPFPALENGTSEQTTLMSAGYTLIFNLVSHHPTTLFARAHPHPKTLIA